MLAYAAPLVLSLAWFLFSGCFGPVILNRLGPKLHPRTNVMLWLGGLFSLAFSALTALVSAAILIGASWFGLDRVTVGLGNFWYVIFLSILPWVVLGLLAGLGSYLITRFEPARKAARETNELFESSRKPLDIFHGVAIQVLEVPLLAAALVDIDRRPTILVTRGVIDSLTESELEAVYWHEVGHAIGEHNGLNRLARFATHLIPWLPLTRDIAAAVDSGCEAWADRFALAKVEPRDLASAKDKFRF